MSRQNLLNQQTMTSSSRYVCFSVPTLPGKSRNFYRLDILPDTQPTVLERFLKMLEFGIKTSRPFESARKQIRCLKLL